ncbi:helix-turn-helix domain-containing protein [Methanocorpusculum parvum]|uniref:XRE family transcriptional regulator n=1 Tax=Methanocorpusculum parvum TaxID=2193 RepID=A0AAX0QA94_9EURY|nr:helix-turn-helix domain-containing protein [Methanocorpusculum parvum]NLC90864.1 helix-turn-helix domain-containing protein [Methanocorpusculum parvum]PAV10186.1 XRE family transcriptional regulator [Methanocorpusculum parvum]HJJ37040.1 helix-turn-helix domain-containing protein [Methanocorpusculum sp.]
MFEQRIFETDFRTALSEELDRRGLSIRQLSEMTGIPAVTLYKIASGERDPRLSTVKKIVAAFSPRHGKFIALIAAKFLLDENEGVKILANGTEYRIKGYAANSLEDCLIVAVRARNDGAAGIICAPILASLIEKMVDVPVAILKPDMHAVLGAAESIGKRL